jgi:hypothetical protein
MDMLDVASVGDAKGSFREMIKGAMSNLAWGRGGSLCANSADGAPSARAFEPGRFERERVRSKFEMMP